MTSLDIGVTGQQISSEVLEPPQSPDKPAGDIDDLSEQAATSNEQIIPEPKQTTRAKFWKVVNENPADFTGWKYLLAHVEDEKHEEFNPQELKIAFDAFLEKYPHCFGYWSRYADFAKRHDDTEDPETIYRKGVRATPLSVQLWLHYINYKINKVKTESGNVNHTYNVVKTVFEHAIDACGLCYDSNTLWEAYLDFECRYHKGTNGVKVFDRVFATPLLNMKKFMEMFVTYVKKYSPMMLLPFDEFLEYHKQVAVKNADDMVNGIGEADDSDDEEYAMDEMELTEGMADDGTVDIPGSCDGQVHDIVLAKKDRVQIVKMAIQRRQKMLQAVQEEIYKRAKFESQIKRNFFHVQPLERAQIRNWKEYLDFEIENGDTKRIVILFERCLVVCALYEEFWLRYGTYAWKVLNDVNLARDVYKRACTIHLPRRPFIHLAWSGFEEHQGNYSESQRILDNINSLVPNLAMVQLRKISLFRRMKKLDDCKALFEKLLADSALSINATCFYSIKYARFLDKVCKDFEAAKLVLQTACDQMPFNSKILSNMISLHYHNLDHCLVDSQQRMVELFDSALNGVNSFEERLMFSQRKMEYLEDFSTDVELSFSAYQFHQALLKENAEDERKLKRRAARESNETNAKTARTNGV